MSKAKLEQILKKEIDINKIAKAVRIAGYHLPSDRKAKKSISADVRFIDNGDGTIADTKSGLIWVKNPHTDMLEQFKGEMPWRAAINACKALDFAGYNDWRLPTVEELRGLVDYTKHEPAIDKVFFSDTKSSWYWTSTTVAGYPGLAWSVYFYYGYVYGYNKDINNYVRPVRSSQ